MALLMHNGGEEGAPDLLYIRFAGCWTTACLPVRVQLGTSFVWAWWIG